MKKIYAIMVAALMSVSLFATPTQADLQSYMEDGYYVACFQAPVDCDNDIYWMGEYVSWNISTPLEDLVKCIPLDGANAGWYVAKVPAANGDDGKPIQLNECGKLTWDVQPSNELITVVAGSVVVDSKDNGESDLKDWSTTEPTIITITSWKNNYNPCALQCAAQSYTIRVYPPYCEYLDDLEPTIKGSFNQWGDAITMEFKGSYFEYVSEPVTASFEFKFNNDAAGSWTHQFEMYDSINDSWTNIPADGNITLANAAELGATVNGTVLTFDFSDDDLFRYAGCDEQEADTNSYAVVVTVKVPAEAPAAGVEIMGDFIKSDWSEGAEMALQEDGSYKVEISAKAGNVFKFRETGNWDNEILTAADGKDLGNLKFSANWTDGADNKKVINLDYSSDAYVWKANYVPVEGIENVVLTEKAQKVMVDGVLYIVRDNKMFNVQGTQVR
ncbi:MAG: hypothetical protein J5761_04960 [Paludibacteraceae bacterium]|nr:hypothetical protein [Paludibacteraceae bacterium]